MNNKETLTYIDSLYANLLEAYDIAGGLRDSFTDMEDRLKSNLLKEQCNIIRNKIYELRQLKSKFIHLANSIE